MTSNLDYSEDKNPVIEGCSETFNTTGPISDDPSYLSKNQDAQKHI